MAVTYTDKIRAAHRSYLKFLGQVEAWDSDERDEETKKDTLGPEPVESQ